MDILELLNQYVFLGQEFLTWLWFVSETEGGVQLADGQRVEVYLGERLVLGPAQGQEGLRITFSGHETRLVEAKEALKRGKLVEAVRLGMELDGGEYWCTLRAHDLGASSIRLPAAAPQEDDGPDGLILERVYLLDVFFKALQGLFAAYLILRTEEPDGGPMQTAMRAWLDED